MDLDKRSNMTTKKMSAAGRKILAGAREARAYARGENVPGAILHKPVDVAAIREELQLSQTAFANTYGLDVRALQDWEQGRRLPERSAMLFLCAIKYEPAAMK